MKELSDANDTEVNHSLRSGHYRKPKLSWTEKGKTLSVTIPVAGRTMRQTHDLSGSRQGAEIDGASCAEVEATGAKSSMGIIQRAADQRPYPVVGSPEMHTGLVFNEAQKWAWAVGPGLDMDDIVSAGHLGILRAMETYDASRCKFSAYALPWVKHFIRRMISKARLVHIPQERINEARMEGENLPYTTYIDENEDDSAGLNLESPSLDMEALIDDNTRKELLIKALSELSPAQRNVVTMRDYKEMHFTEIGLKLGVSDTRAKQIYSAAIQILRNYMIGSDDVESN